MSEIAGILRSFWDIFVGTLKSLVTAVEMVAGSIGFLGVFIGYLPAIVSAGVIIFLAVYVIRFLLLK